MKEFRLGLRLLLGSGRGNRVRFVLMTVGTAVGVCCLALVLAIPGILAAQDGRMAARYPAYVQGGSGAGSRFDTYVWTRDDPYGSQPFRRVFVALGKHSPKPPPGLSRLPGDGEMFVSPRLRAVLHREPSLGRLLPGQDRGLIGAEGLAHPDELYAYVGVSRDVLLHGGYVSHFGRSYPPDRTVEPSTLDILRFTLAGVVLLPLAVFLSVCARLSAASRARRLAALRLLGLSTKGTQRVNAAETVASAALGAVMGLCLYWVINHLVSRVGLPGFKWYPSDGTLSAALTGICLLGCPALAWFVGRASARKAASNPLAVRRTAVEKPPSKWGLLSLVPGAGIVIGYCVAGAAGRAPKDGGLTSVLMPAAVVLVGVGLVMTLPVFSQVLARRLARSAGSLALSLAMRRNEVEPGGALRVASGLVLLVYAASLVQGVLIELDQVSTNTSAVQTYTVPLTDLSERKQHALEQVPGVSGHAVVMNSWADDEGRAGFLPATNAVVATCGQLRSVARVDGCVDGRPLRLLEPNQTDNEYSKPGARFTFRLRGGDRHHTMHLTVPSETLRVHDLTGSLAPFSSGDVLLPPSMLPDGARPEDATLVLVSSSDHDTVRAVLDGIGGVDPTTDVTTPGIVVTSLQQITVVKTLLMVGMVLGLVIGVAAYLVAAADRAVERRAQVTALALLGARPRTLRAVQVAQVVLPLAVGLLLAVVTGKAAESSYLVTGGGSVFWDGDGVPLLLASAVGAVVVAALGALPLIGRRIDPELIRRD